METQLEIIVPPVNGHALSRCGEYLCYYWQRPLAPHQARQQLAVGANLFVCATPIQESLEHPYVTSARIPSFRHPDIAERCAQTLKGIHTALIANWPACQFGLPYSLSAAVAMKPWIQLIEWTMTAFAESGEKYVSIRLKGVCSWARYLASPSQLYGRPAPITRFPFADKSGRFVPSRLFTGSLASKASSSRSLMRLSRLSRALPPGGKESQMDALRDHFELMQTAPVTDPALPSYFKKVAVKISRGKRLRNVQDAGFALSNSACLEASRKEGGSMGYLRKMLWNYFPDAFYDTEVDEDGSVERASRPNEGLPMDIPPVKNLFHRLCTTVAFRDTEGIPRRYQEPVSGALCGYEEDFPPLYPLHRVVAIPDRGGFKSRVVTAGPAALQALAHNVRKVLYRNVLSKIETHWALKESGVFQFFDSLDSYRFYESIWRPYGPPVLLSSDLSAATDRFPFVLVESINDGLEENLSASQIASANWCAWRSLSGKQNLHYRDYDVQERGACGAEAATTKKIVEQTCGNLMGTAPSWFHLNVFNKTLFMLAWSIWCDFDFRVAHSTLLSLTHRDSLEQDWAKLEQDVLQLIGSAEFRFPNAPIWESSDGRDQSISSTYCLIGDDLGAVCPYAVAILYEVLGRLANCKLSAGKHFVQPYQEGNFLLIAEEFAVVRNGILVPLPIEHLRGIASVQSSFDRRDKRCLWAQIGSTLTSAVEHSSGERRKALLSYAMSNVAEWRSALLKEQLPVYLPTSLGGLGWPHPCGELAGLERTADKCLLHYQYLRGYRSDPIRFAAEIAKTKICWTTSLEFSEFGPLIDLYAGYLSSLTVSRSKDSRLAPPSDEAPIGVDIDGECPHSIPLEQFLNEVCQDGIAVRYLIREPFMHEHAREAGLVGAAAMDTNLVSSQPRAEPVFAPEARKKEPFSIASSGRAYRQRCRELAVHNAGFKAKLIVPRSNFVDMIREDELFLKCLVIIPCKDVAGLFPHYCRSQPSGTGDEVFVFGRAIEEPHPVV